VLSQVASLEERMVPNNYPIFSKKLEVPFNEHAKQEVFQVSASLDESTSYTIVLTNSDLQIDEISLTEPNGESTIADHNLYFKTTVRGMYTFSVRGHYLLSSELGSMPPPPLAPNQPYPQHATRDFSDGFDPRAEIDDTVDVAIFELVEKTENVHPYGFLFPVSVSLILAAAVFSIIQSALKRRNVTEN